MCGNGVAGAVALLLIVINLAFRNVLGLWIPTIVLGSLAALVSVIAPMLQLGIFGVGGVLLCLSPSVDTAYIWLWGISVMLFGTNAIYSIGSRRARARGPRM